VIAEQDPAMTRASELLFVDPAVSDLAGLLGGLRLEVEAIVLEAARPAARQIASALAGREALGAVHIVAHGSPGRISFAAGEWLAATHDAESDDLGTCGVVNVGTMAGRDGRQMVSGLRIGG